MTFENDVVIDHWRNIANIQLHKDGRKRKECKKQKDIGRWGAFLYAV